MGSDDRTNKSKKQVMTKKKNACKKKQTSRKTGAGREGVTTPSQQLSPYEIMEARINKTRLSPEYDVLKTQFNRTEPAMTYGRNNFIRQDIHKNPVSAYDEIDNIPCGKNSSYCKANDEQVNEGNFSMSQHEIMEARIMNTSVEEEDANVWQQEGDIVSRLNLRVHPAPNRTDPTAVFNVFLYTSLCAAAYRPPGYRDIGTRWVNEDGTQVDWPPGFIPDQFDLKHRYAYVIHSIKLVVVVFKGTDLTDLSDIKADVHIFSGFCSASSRFQKSLLYCNEVMTAFPGFRYVATGHSLGGTVAAFIGGIVRPQWSIVTFNMGVGLRNAMTCWPASTFQEKRTIDRMGPPVQYHFSCMGDIISDRLILETPLFRQIRVFGLRLPCKSVGGNDSLTAYHSVDWFDCLEVLNFLEDDIQPLIDSDFKGFFGYR